MGLLDILERTFVPSRTPRSVKVDLKELFCDPRGRPPLKTIRTAAVGVAYNNIDGSKRQDALRKLKVGDRVRLIWNADRGEKREVVYLVLEGKGRRLSMRDCFGRLNDKVAAEVVRGAMQENVMTAATVVDLVGGTRKRPRLGCVLELTCYAQTASSRGA